MPYASSSFAARSHSPLDLLQPKDVPKSGFLAYMAYVSWISCLRRPFRKPHCVPRTPLDSCFKR